MLSPTSRTALPAQAGALGQEILLNAKAQWYLYDGSPAQWYLFEGGANCSHPLPGTRPASPAKARALGQEILQHTGI